MPQGLTTPRPDHLFKPGNPHSANRKGQKGARQKLAATVFTDAAEHWDEHGPGALRRLAFHDPAAYCAFIAKLVPQRVEHEVATPFDDVDESLLALSMRLAQSIAFLPDEDREMLGMLLDKGEMLASQKKLERQNAEEGVGGQSHENIFGGKGTPHPQSFSSADRLIDVSPTAAGKNLESSSSPDVIDAEVIEEDEHADD